ncbi:MAG: DUF4097 domain-containing protein [Sphingobacterium sp.]|jgi:hypothetical protein|nr:DUF4097 domain-containing protein [Sphingobacterium sp.]
MKTNKWIWILMVVVLAGVMAIVPLMGSKKLEMTEQILAEEIQNIEVFNDSWDLEMKESADNQIHVDVVGKQKDKKKVPVVITHKDHKLMIRQDKQIGGAFSAFAWGKEGTIQISIPKNTAPQVTINNLDGDIDMGARQSIS